jgi:hypothetical protein
MWILPKSLISAYAPDTVALTWDSGECSQTCAQSLMRRSKPSQSSAYLREWKAGNLMRLRSGAISSRSLGRAFEAWWTSSLAATRASHSVPPGSEQEQTTHATSGHTSEMALNDWLPGFASLKMSRDISRWDSPASSAIWKRWVTKCRGEYLARLNAARLTSDAEFTSLPTPCANEDSFRLSGNSQQSRCLEARSRRGELGEAGPLNPEFVEVMMGLSTGWTDCASSGTA